MDKRKGKPVNSVDIARMAGVSRGTVSKVLNNYPGISEETRQKVMEAVERSGYYPNISAQALTGKNRRVLCFFRFDTGEGEPHAAYTGSLIALGVYNVASQLGYQVLSVLLKPDGSDLEQVDEVFRQGRADAFITEGHALLEESIRQLAVSSVVGVIDRPQGEQDPSTLLSVDLDNYRSGAAAIEYLHSLGHRRIALINGSRDWASQRLRLQGFLDALEQRGLPPANTPVDCAGFYERDGRARMLQILEEGSAPTAVACANDNLAFGAIQALQEKGLGVPGDVSVIGMENNPVGPYYDPPLTTLRLDIEGGITDLVTAVVRQVEGKELPPKVGRYDSRLIERGSCSAGPAK